MGRYDSWLEDIEFPRLGFWLVHIIFGAAFFFLGMRFAMRRAPLSIMAYRMLRALSRR